MSAIRIYATDNIAPQGWRRDAACLGAHQTMDLPDDARHINQNQVKLALSMCTSCPVRDTCAEHTLKNPPAHHCVQAGFIWTEQESRNQRAHLENKPRVACATTSGYNQHITRGEETCQPCRDAEAAFRRDISHHRKITNPNVLF